ncbi:DUF411 domain-containing protein [Aeromonas schubertii]|uniref:DUF411 domain-containing protein n=1 Tax=Aeromonas schubertii TaxID=652 RepID=A0ABS7VCP6_9GAMM|nr:DUF411 domain-containing protein [Aeromonas schubertii]KUE78270.1 metal-binding protein [Aeromonas schubertii]MBZ6066856.1 DUF411 domain-containing protein [Aeromonas schubertii]MBZ6073745.1 DUF411 domain-containing protein [Aeromonas schubertii]QCG49948.1 DUF411 domain-containing protein [Aeromonas schubertii]
MKLASRLLAMMAGVAAFSAVAGQSMTVYESPYCGCCKGWVKHMEENGFDVKVVETNDLATVKARYGIRPELSSCHTGIVEGYVVEGHVPAADVKRLLKEKPAIQGLTIPGMPQSAPGMDIPGHPYEVLSMDKEGKTARWSAYPG